MIRLTPHFTVSEFLVSTDHPDLAAKMSISDEEVDRLYLLCSFGLEQVRKAFGKTIILSGKRSKELNHAVGGSLNSQHMTCRAADFIVPTKDLHEVFTFIKHDLFWPGELIRYRNKNFIHMALPQYGCKADVFERP